MLFPICLIVFGWSFSKTLPIIGAYIPQTPGLESYSGMSLLATYCVARLYRLNDYEHRWKPAWIVLTFIGLLVLSSVGLCEYDSPVAAGLACCSFFLISQLRLNERLGRFVQWVSQSMFAIYIISVGGGWGVISYCVLALEKTSIILAAVVAGIAVFLFAILIDIPRRILLLIGNDILKHILNKVDAWYDDLHFIHFLASKTDNK